MKGAPQSSPAIACIDEATALLAEYEATPLAALMAKAGALARRGHEGKVSYSRKVFIPLTRLCRDVCSYCTFAKTPSRVASPYLSVDEVLRIAEAGRKAGCNEALFTLGDKPELRYAAAREALAGLGHKTTVEYTASIARTVFKEAGLLPHINAGVMSEAEIAQLRAVSVSQGLMLESISRRLGERGGPHYGSPDKDPQARIDVIAASGRQRVPFTTGILIGIGETRLDRLASLLVLRDLHREYGHIQEIIVQNFRAKADTRMARAEEPGFDELVWTTAVARLIFGAGMNIQVPPNLSYADFPRLLHAGINDWGGISPVTPDHVNPEAPWPDIANLRDATASAGLTLVERLAAYPEYCLDGDRWFDSDVRKAVNRLIDSDGLARSDEWSPGLAGMEPPTIVATPDKISDRVADLIGQASAGDALGEADIVSLFAARGADLVATLHGADEVRRARVGDTVTYVVNRNINYTNVCGYRCRFCAFSKGKTSLNLRGTPYDLDLDEVRRRVREAWDRGATEVCMQGGIHPDYTGHTYLLLLRAAKEAAPDIHVHAFSPLEVRHGAATLGLSVRRYLEELRDAGLGTLPGTAAEILDDDVRAVICPDKLNTAAWLDTVRTAHEVGLRTTATIMFGHVEQPRHWARHLLAIRDLQRESGGFTEFVPLPFVHMEAPLYHLGAARKGPTFREAVLMHAVARLALNGLIDNIQVSWVKMGSSGVAACLAAGANDLGGTLMNESISRAAGSAHGEEFPPDSMCALIEAQGRPARQRTTLYGEVPAAISARAMNAGPLAPISLPAAGRRARVGGGHSPAAVLA